MFIAFFLVSLSVLIQCLCIVNMIGLCLLREETFAKLCTLTFHVHDLLIICVLVDFARAGKLSTFCLWLCRHMADNIIIVIGVMKIIHTGFLIG